MTDGLLGAAALQRALRRQGVRPRRALGQNFVIDPNTIRRILAVADLAPSARVLEIGAGAGSLTLALARVAERVTAVELDRALLPVLEEILAGVANVTIVHADAMRLDLGRVDAAHLVANLPYNIATPLLLKVLREAPRITRITVMTQREVGERLAAAPGSRSYGHASVAVGFFATARVAMRVSRYAFYPMPRVDSVVVSIRRRGGVRPVDGERLLEVTSAAFSQRRKTLRRALASLAGSPEAAVRALERAGLDPGARAETVGVEGFIALTAALGR
jgi:16S rRNA (adenine1518-N6/adenine1519-N6)-dimethyltransferase